MAQSTEDIEYDISDDISDELLAWSMLQDPEANNMTDTNTSAPTLETFPVPSGSSSLAFTFNPPYTEHSNAQAAGGPLNITTGLDQGPMPVTDDGPEESTVKVNLVPEIEPVSQKFKRSALTKDKSQKPKRARAPNWDDSEKSALLVLKLDALKRGTSLTKGLNWSKYVSTQLKEKHDFDRASKSCQQQWDTLMKQYHIIQEHESNILSSNCVSYWVMEEHERIELNEKLPQNQKLPQGFYFGWYVLMENIIQVAKKTPPRKESTSIQMGANLACTSTHVPSISTMDSKPISSQLGTASDANRSQAALSSQDFQTSMIPPRLGSNLVSTYHLGNQQSPEEEVLDMSLPCTQGNHKLHEDVTKELDMTNDDLNFRIAPFVLKLIKDTLKPIMSFFQKREESEDKHKVEILAIKREKLVLKREKHLLFTHRGTTSNVENVLGTSAYAQAGVGLNLASTSFSQGEHIAEHADVKIMHDHPHTR